MSRYTYNATNSIEITVGWDNPTQTFFGDITDHTDDSHFSTMLDSGRFNIKNLDELQQAMGGWDIPKHIREQLEADHEAAPAPTPLQRRMAAAFGNA